MKLDEGIFCYQHCQSAKVFTFSLPEKCIFCAKDLSNTEHRIPPFRVRNPFKDATKSSFSLVIKPTNGDFLNDFEHSSDLHIGITNSTGCVFEYDYNGINKSSNNNWNQCICIQLKKKMNLLERHIWDKNLNFTFLQDCWSATRYNAVNHNCFSYVLTFLESLQFEDLNPYLKDKVSFCHHFILPETQYAQKYIKLFRRVKRLDQVIG